MYAASSASTQNPSTVNTPLDIEFGAAQSLTNVSIASTGVVTFLTAGQYLLEVSLRLSRTAATGAAIIYTRALYNGAQTLASSSATLRSEEHTSELQSLMRISYAVFCLKKKKNHTNTTTNHNNKI